MFPGKFYSGYSEVSLMYLQTEAQILRQLNHIHTLSRDELSVIVEGYNVPPSQVFIVPPGYDERIFRPNLRDGDTLNNSPINIFHANRIAIRKGQTYFLSIVSEAKRRGINLIVHIVGLDTHTYNAEADNSAQEFVRAVSELGLNNNFVFYDIMPHRGLFEVMKQCEVAIYPSVSETFGLSALEAMATGLPTIVFDDVPAFRDFITPRETGLMVPRSAEAVVDQLEELVKDLDLYRGISREGIRSARQFTWESVMQLLMNTYRERGLIN